MWEAPLTPGEAAELFARLAWMEGLLKRLLPRIETLEVVTDDLVEQLVAARLVVLEADTVAARWSLPAVAAFNVIDFASWRREKAKQEERSHDNNQQ